MDTQAPATPAVQEAEVLTLMLDEAVTETVNTKAYGGAPSIQVEIRPAGTLECEAFWRNQERRNGDEQARMLIKFLADHVVSWKGVTNKQKQPLPPNEAVMAIIPPEYSNEIYGLVIDSEKRFRAKVGN